MASDRGGSDQEKSGGRRLPFIRPWMLLILSAVLVAAVALAILKARDSRIRSGMKQVAPAISVTAAPARTADFDIFVTGLGTVTPISTVTVRTRVDGQLMEVLYKEGQMVESGTLLARLDRRPFEAQLLQAEGQLARDEAQLKQALVDLERYRELWAEDSIAKQTYDLQASLVGQLEGAVKADRGAVETAKVNLIYCRIISPVAGRVGLRLVDPGNIVHVTDVSGIVVITQLKPMTVIFPIPEDRLPEVREKMKTGATLEVEAYDRNMARLLETGKLLTVDNQIDTSTGTVRLRAVFPNEKDGLFPNQFVNARLLVERARGATVVPAAAVQQGPDGAFVFVVGRDMTVTVRPVTVGAVQGGEGWIRKGLDPGESVVIEGSDRLRAGARVELKPRADSGGQATKKGYL